MMQMCVKDERDGKAMAAEGTSEITNIHYVERGYEDIIGKLSGIGADIQVVDEPDPEARSVGAAG